MPNPFANFDSGDLGVQAADVVAAGGSLLAAVAPLVLLGLAIAFTPALIGLVRKAIKGNNSSK